MTVATPVQPNRASDSGAQYPANIDAAIAALAQMGWRFAPHEQATPNMTVRLDAGTIFTATAATVVAAQSTGTITAPVGNPRIDRVVVDVVTGAVSVITGTPAGSPSAPAITAGKLPVCQVLLQTTSTAITNAMITDERSPVLAINNYLWSGAALAVANGGTGATTVAAARAALGIGYPEVNKLINGDFAVNQRVISNTSCADDVYSLDCWYVLTQTGAVNVLQQTDQEDGTPFNIRLSQAQASAQRMGVAQILEERNCKFLRGQQVTLSFRARISNSQAIRYAILEWTGTADSVTSDVVNDWTNGTYTAGQFFLGSNLTIAAVGSITPSANTWTDVTALTATLSSSLKNLVVMVWTEGTAAQNVTLDVARIQVELGSAATTFEHLSYDVNLRKCQRYIEAFENPTGATAIIVGMGQCYSTTHAYLRYQFLVEKRVRVTTVTQFGSSFTIFDAATAGVTLTNLGMAGSGFQDTRSALLDATVASGLVAGNATMMYSNNSNQRLVFSGAEL